MQVLIMYYSKTGNTQKLADAIAHGVRQVDGVTCVVKPVAEITTQDWLAADGIIAGSPVYAGSMAAEMKAIFDTFAGIWNHIENKIGAAFATGGVSSGGKETTLFSIIQAMLIYGMIVVGDPLEATGHYGVACVGAPDPETTSHAAKLGKRVAALVKQLNS
jgi:NAD(P)H dehydrogenase (quinone)